MTLSISQKETELVLSTTREIGVGRAVTAEAYGMKGVRRMWIERSGVEETSFRLQRLHEPQVNDLSIVEENSR
eukprot:scaffold64_cov338-Pavlova_lutheri.AAC.84